MNNILLIKPGAIGDLLQITPVIRALAEKFPQAKISVLVGSSPTASLFRHNPLVFETIIFDRKGEHRSIKRFMALWFRLRCNRYDLVVNFQRSNLKGWLLSLSALPCRMLIYNKARGRVVHAVVNHLETIAPLGIDIDRYYQLQLFFGPDDIAFAERVIFDVGLDRKPLVALNPGASNRIKCWSTKNMATLGDRLIDELGVHVVLVGAPDERDLADEIVSFMKNSPTDLVGKTSLLQLGALLARCTVVVSGDTGPMHMATAVGTPVVALFGAIEPARTGPVGQGHVVVRHAELACVPCNDKRCNNDKYLECMDLITVDEVYRELAKVLKERNNG